MPLNPMTLKRGLSSEKEQFIAHQTEILRGSHMLFCSSAEPCFKLLDGRLDLEISTRSIQQVVCLQVILGYIHGK